MHVHFRVAQSAKKIFPESDVQLEAKVWGFTVFHSISLWVWHSREIYVTTPPQTVVGGRVCPLKFFVFAPPSFLVSLPYANTGIRSKNVKHEWSQRCELCQWTKMWSTIICMMCGGENFQISPRLPKRKNKCVRSLVYFMPCLLWIFERERASVVVWSLMFLGLMYVCFNMCLMFLFMN